MAFGFRRIARAGFASAQHDGVGNWASFVGRSHPWIFFGPVDPRSGWARLRAIHTTCLGMVDEKLKLKVRRQHHDHAIS